MKKKSNTYHLFKIISILIGIPIIIIWILIIMLYIPPVQDFTVQKICHEIKKSSGFEVKIGSFHLALPLELCIADFEVSRNDTVYAKGKRADVDISFVPLLKGEVEANYISLEESHINTANLFPGAKIDGKIGFLRVVARNIDLKNETANLRQIHLHSTDIAITLNDTTNTEKETENEPSKWIVNLHRGSIENCNLQLRIPNDTLYVKADLGKLLLRQGAIDIASGRYSISTFALENSGVRYDAGDKNRETDPLNHIEFENINLACRNIGYTPDSTKLELQHLNFVQPGGIRITDASTTLFADKEKLRINNFNINSKNGSYATANATMEWSSLIGNNGIMEANLAFAVKKNDLFAFLTKEQYEALEPFGNNMFNGTFAVSGETSYMNIDTIDIDIPAIATLQASGYAKNLNTPDAQEAKIELKCKSCDIKRFIGDETDEKTNGSTIEIEGEIDYSAKKATTELNITGMDGTITAKASYDIDNRTYDTDIDINDIDITTIFNDLPLTDLTAKIKGNGEGFDIFAQETEYDIELSIDTVVYGNINLNGITMNANQSKNVSNIALESNAEQMKFCIKAETELNRNNINNRTIIDISEADLMMSGTSRTGLSAKSKIDIEASTDMKESHALKLHGRNISITTPNRVFTPADITLDFATTPDSSYITANNGDLEIRGAIKSGYSGLFKSIDQIGNMFKEATKTENTLYYIHDYAKELPDIFFDFKCGKNNMFHNYLSIKDININSMKLGVSINEQKGININSGVYGFRTGELNLDTIRFFTVQEENNIRYLAGVRSTAVSPKQEKLTFSSMLYGDIYNDSITTNFVFRDKKDGVGLMFGFNTLVKPKELNFSFSPEAVLFNNRFNFNKNNHVTLKSDGNVSANVILKNESDAGMHLYTVPNEDSRLNANLELFNIDLSELTSVMPFVPDIAGILNLELYLNKSKDDMMLSSDIRIDSVAYEDTPIGNETIEIVYFPKDTQKHYLDIKLSHNEEEIAHLSGDYLDDINDPGLDGEISMTRFPLNMTKAFMQNTGMSLNGYVNSRLTAEGKLSALSTNGYMQFDSVYLNAPLFGTGLHLSDKKVEIVDNRISFRNFNIYAKGDTPFNMNGTVDLNSITNPEFNLRMNAKDYEIVNAPRARNSILYGRMFIDLRAFINGTLNSLKVHGDATLLGKSNITYVMQETPISTDKELDGLVEFVNFQDTAKVEEIKEEADFGNMSINVGLKIEDGARINADFNANRSSYIMLRGGGELNMTYTGDDGINVTGTYVMNDGELKYEMPIIPLKTFHITDGSKVTWSGDILDPTLEITAIERITTSVEIDDNGMQPVAFDVGVKLSNTLSNMGLTFTISAPENAVVQDQLNSLDAETLNKYAVTMLITGTYIGSTKGLTVSNALSSFLDAKINDLAGSAIKSVSVNVGINDAENSETGGTYKNYSFSFKKRFWNDRLTIVIGGEVNSGDHPTANDSFINNVSLEWKISDSSNRYLRLFYDKNYESLLEGEIIETGIGYVYKKKLQNLRELFIFKKENKSPIVPPMGMSTRKSKPQKGEQE